MIPSMYSLFYPSLFNPIVLYIFAKPVLNTKHKNENKIKKKRERNEMPMLQLL